MPAGLGEGNPPIGAFHRQYGSDPAAVAADVEQVAASQGAGVLTILKHFPGLGRVTANTSSRAVDRTATADDPYLEPFVAGIRAGSAGVMISSASYPKLDRDLVLTIRAADAAPMTAAMIAEARTSPAFAARVADAVGHVLQAKVRAGLLSCPS